MNIVSASLLLLLVLSYWHCGEALHKRVINGINAPKDKYKWAVFLQGDEDEESETNCGATIIDRQWLLTAAHCFLTIEDGKVNNMSNPSLWHATAGVKKVINEYEENLNEEELPDLSWLNEDNFEGVEFEKLKRDSERQSQKILHLHVGNIIIHPKYKGDDAEYDIALMKLKTPIQPKFIGKLIDILPLPPKNVKTKWPKYRQKCFLVGWGCVENGHKGTISDIGQLAVLKVQKNDFCEKIYENQAELNAEHEMCAGSYMKKMGVCAGDSGSGLVCRLNGKWALAGVTSATHSKRPEDFPGLFTRVSYFTDWIRNVMNTT